MGNENNNFKMLYANVQGMLGIGKLERWDKINRLCEENRWDVIAFTETHWREGSKTGSIKGYQIFEKRRGIEEKKGGGLAVWVKNNIESYVWEAERLEEDPDTELIWVIIKGGDVDIAVGVIYMGIQGRKNRTNNDKLERMIREDIVRLKEEEKAILLIGDFNGHINREINDINYTGDENGERLLRIVRESGLIIINNTK